MKRPRRYEESGDNDSMLCKRVVTKDRRYITQITCYEKGNKVGTGELTLLTNDKAPFVPMTNKIISTTRQSLS